VKETIDGNPKSIDFLKAEYGITKVRSINSLRTAYAQKRELISLGMTIDQVDKMQEEYFKAPIIQDKYETEDIDSMSAQFVPTDDVPPEQ
jgi:hypothetical protein